ncbi:hypothetical protein BpHYR1_048963, partial [Brachionus plicatilis]
VFLFVESSFCLSQVIFVLKIYILWGKVFDLWLKYSKFKSNHMILILYLNEIKHKFKKIWGLVDSVIS